MIHNLAPHHQRLIAVSILLLGIILISSVTVVPVIIAHLDYNDEIESLTDKLHRYKRIAAKKPVLQKHVEQLQRAMPAQNYYLRNTGEALAAAELSSIVKNAIKANNGELISTRTVPGKDGETTKGFNRVTIKVEMRGNVNALHSVLHKLEMGTPLLFINHTRVRARSQVRRSRQKKKRASVGSLDIRFNVTGYSRNIGK